MPLSREPAFLPPVLGAACLVVLFFVGAVAGADVGRDVSLYEEYLEAIRTLSFDFQYSRFESGGALGAEEKQVEFARGSVSVRGREFRLRKRTRVLLWRGETFGRADVGSEEIVTAERRLHIQANYSTNADAFELMDLPEGPGQNLLVSLWEKDHQEGAVIETQGSLFHAFFGSLPYDEGRSLVSFLRSDKVDPVAPIEADGHRVKQITSHGMYGTHSLWLDLESRGVPRRIEWRKTGDDLYGDTPLSQTPRIRQPGADQRRPTGRLRDFRFEVGNIELAMPPPSDREVMSRFEVLQTELYEGGGSFVQRIPVELSQLRFECSDSDLEPSMQVPDGTAVTIMNAPRIDAEWRAGAVVKVVNPDAIARFDNLDKLDKLSPSPRTWLVVVNAAVIVILASMWFRRHRRVHRSTVPDKRDP